MMDLLKSKKFQAAIIGVVISIVLYFFPDAPEEAVEEVIVVIVGYILAQGLADFGKSRAQVENPSTSSGQAQGSGDGSKR